MSTTKSSSADVAPYGAAFLMGALMLSGAILFTPAASADEHDVTEEYDAGGVTEEPQAVPDSEGTANDPLPEEFSTEEAPVTDPAAVEEAPAEEAVVDEVPTQDDLDALPAQAAEASPATNADPMAGTLESVVETVEDIETNVSAGEMDIATATAMIEDLQTVVDLIEATLGQ